MRIKKIHIQNYKSLVDFELDNPPPFCAFVGPNASGKSNIFEALEFTNYAVRFAHTAPAFFKGSDAVLSYINKNPKNTYQIKFAAIFKKGIEINFAGVFSPTTKDSFSVIYEIHDDNVPYSPSRLSFADIRDSIKRKEYIDSLKNTSKVYENEYEVFVDNFLRVFIGKSDLNRLPVSQNRFAPDASNLSDVLGRIFESELKWGDFLEWVRILIPEFENIEIKKSNIDGSYEFFVYEKSSGKPFPKHLISDGTYNILALMAAVYQSSEPQFLCIEEPENGLHPQAIEFLVDFFREKCEQEGHHIWLNTHSPTLVRCMKIDEIVLVNKINGETRAKRVVNMNDLDIKTDEAWLTNALGGGVSWSK